MALRIVLDKVDETEEHVVYEFGSPACTVGSVRVAKRSGDVELLGLTDAESPPRPPFYLAEVVPRLHDYHTRTTYPPTDCWTT